MIRESETVVWASADCESWGECERGSLFVVRAADLTGAERDAIEEAEEAGDAAGVVDVLRAASERLNA